MLIVIDVQKYFLNRETIPIVKRIREFLKKKANGYSAIYFTVFKSDQNSSLWKIAEWRGCTDSADLVLSSKTIQQHFSPLR